ncbi:hypothetical protein M1567_01480 [Candidatus Marsarchaeota archaeon]|nr:hypothetical protein [Candidatus Marsarchaeota archaeon]
MKKDKAAKRKIPRNQRTFDDFALLRNDEIAVILERMKEKIDKLNDDADISEINAFSRSMERDLERLKINVAGVKERFGMLDMLKKQLDKNPDDPIIESAINSLERSYALRLVELANEQIEKYC